MELRDLKYFVLAAEMEHISRAADKLGVSQPFLTKVIKQLETEPRAPLMDHKGRGVELNAYGRVVYERAKNVLAEINAIYDDIGEMLDQSEKALAFLSIPEAISPTSFRRTDSAIPTESFPFAIVCAKR